MRYLAVQTIYRRQNYLTKSWLCIHEADFVNTNMEAKFDLIKLYFKKAMKREQS